MTDDTITPFTLLQAFSTVPIQDEQVIPSMAKTNWRSDFEPVSTEDLILDSFKTTASKPTSTMESIIRFEETTCESYRTVTVLVVRDTLMLAGWTPFKPFRTFSIVFEHDEHVIPSILTVSFITELEFIANRYQTDLMF
jgi:hypothetical protein